MFSHLEKALAIVVLMSACLTQAAAIPVTLEPANSHHVEFTALDIKRHQHPESWRNGYTLFRIDFGRRSGRTIQMRNVQLREPSEEERKAALTAASGREQVTAFDQNLQTMLRTQYEASITKVAATADTITISFDVPEDRADIYLCEPQKHPNESPGLRISGHLCNGKCGRERWVEPLCRRTRFSGPTLHPAQP